MLEYHRVDIDNIYQTLDGASSFDRPERRHRREVQHRVEELAGKVEELSQYEGKEFGTCGVQGAASSDETDSVESHDEEIVVEASLNINEVERAALKAINSEVYNIADHVHSGDAEEPLSGYWVQALPTAP